MKKIQVYVRGTEKLLMISLKLTKERIFNCLGQSEKYFEDNKGLDMGDLEVKCMPMICQFL